jgi:opacity protein-like surface antigen
MLKKVVIGALLCVALGATAASAQTPRIVLSGLVGWTFADGVSGNSFLAADGNVYNRLDPKDSVHFGFSGGVMVNPNTEVGFLYRRQITKLEAGGTNTREIGDLNIDNYHGYFTYYFGDPEAKFQPYFTGGFGATHFSDVNATTIVPATLKGETQFSTMWGAGIQIHASHNVGFKGGFNWTPIYIKSDPSGWWCDPYWGGCYVVGNAQYANQFELFGAVTIRF